MKILLAFALFSSFAFLTGCSSGNNSAAVNQNAANSSNVFSQIKKSVQTRPATVNPNELWITREEYADKWAFTADRGMLRCEGQRQTGSVIFAADGKDYAVNGAAKATGKYAPLEEIWADNPMIPGTKINIETFIRKGLELCN